MWKNLCKLANPLKKLDNFLNPEAILQQHLRTTYILKRRFPVPLHKKGQPPRPFRKRHYVYDLIKSTSLEKFPNLDVILTSYVEGLGNVGDRLSVKYNYGYHSLLLPGLAIYATPENVEHYKDHKNKDEEVVHSSPFAEKIASALSQITLSVVMNKETPWVLKPWHIKASFRKASIIVPEAAIAMPAREIIGPDMDLEGKEFAVTVTINNLEKANVRCRIHHWSTVITERIPHHHNFWLEPTETIFAEDAPILSSLPSRVAVEAQK